MVAEKSLKPRESGFEFSCEHMPFEYECVTTAKKKKLPASNASTYISSSIRKDASVGTRHIQTAEFGQGCLGFDEGVPVVLPVCLQASVGVQKSDVGHI